MTAERERSFTSSRDSRLEEALAEYYTSLDEGCRLDRHVFLDRYPDLREELEKIFESEGFVEKLEGKLRHSREAAGCAAPLAVGCTLGDYEILEEIAQGGMGIVYRARQRSLGRTVALKVILAGEFASERARRRFRREAEMAAALDHPNIVPVYEVGEEGGLCYLAMKLIDGKSLAECGLPEKDRWRFAARTLETVARASHHAHEHGIIHRDLKPANVLMDGSGEPHIVDFGLARLQDHSGSLTQAGAVLGTLRYMAPEQASGESSEANVTLDVYGLGALLYQVLVGLPPFQASSSVGLLKQVLHEEPPHPAIHDPAVPRDLVTICLKCLDKNPRKRYQTAEEVADDLKRFLERRPILARPAGPIERAMKWARRRPATVTIVALLMVLALVSVVLRLGYERELRRRAVVAEQRERLTRHRLYASQLSRARDAVTRREFTPARRSLGMYRPSEAEEDLRGFGWYLLWRRTHADLATRTIGRLFYGWVRFTPDNRWLGATTPSGVVIWDVRDLVRGVDVDPVLEPISSDYRLLGGFAFSPDGKSMALEHTGNRVEILDLGLETDPFRTVARYVAWPPGSGAVVTLSTSGELRVIEMPSRRTLRSFETRPPLSNGFAVPSRGHIAAVVEAGGVLSVWSLESGERTGSLVLNDVTNTTADWLTFSPDGTLLASAHRDFRVTLWDTSTCKKRSTLSGHSGIVFCVAFSPDGRLLASGSDDRSIRIWDVDRGEELCRLLGHDSRVMCVTFDPSGDLLASSSGDGYVKLWDVSRDHWSSYRPWVRLLETDYTIRTLVCTPTGKTVIVGELDAVTHVVDLDARTGVKARLLDTIPAQERYGPYLFAAYSPDGRLAVGVTPEHQVAIRRVVRQGDTITLEEAASPGGHESKVESGGFSPDGTLLGTNDGEGQVKIWRRESNAPAFRLEAEIPTSCDGIDLVFSPDGRYLAVSCKGDILACLCDSAQGYEVITLPEKEDRPFEEASAILFSPDSRFLATGGRDGVVRLWKLDGRVPGEPPIEFLRCHGHVADVYSLAFSPDGRRLASGSGDTTIKIWDVSVVPPDGDVIECLTLRGHEGQVTALAFTPDGRTLLSGGDRRGGGAEVFAWRGATDEEVGRYFGVR